MGIDWQFVVGTGIAVIFSFLAYAVKDMPPPIAWAGVTAGVLLVIWGIVPNHDKFHIAPTLTSIFLIAALLASILWGIDSYNDVPKSSTEKELEASPASEPISPNVLLQLVVDSVGTQMEFHLQLENLQNSIPIIRIRTVLTLPDRSDAEVAPPFMRELRPGQRLSLSYLPSRKFSLLFVELHYSTKQGNNEREFTSRYRFDIPSHLKPGMPIDPSEHGDIVGNVGEKPTNKVERQLSQPEGTVFIVLPERRSDGFSDVGYTFLNSGKP